MWVVAAPVDAASIWAVTLEDGRVQAFRASEDGVEPLHIAPDRLPAGTPALLLVEGGVASLVAAPSGSASPLTHPVLLPSGGMAFIESSGDLVVVDQDVVTRLSVDALPDARLLVDEGGRVLLLGDATTRYGHGVLGDAVEAGSVILVDTVPHPQVATTIPLPGDTVVEGLSPIWADLTGDGEREIVVTVSDAERGAQIVVYSGEGELVAAGPAIGRGHRWRHQLAVAPFGPHGELELADVLTPHLGGVVEFYRVEGDALRIVARVPGYTSHRIGSRNLDGALAGDLDGDGRVELMLPDQGMTELGAVRRTPDGAQVMWSVPAGGRIGTNLAAASLTSGEIAVGIGREDGVLRLWLPD
jgi:hypothetical protein